MGDLGAQPSPAEPQDITRGPGPQDPHWDTTCTAPRLRRDGQPRKPHVRLTPVQCQEILTLSASGVSRRELAARYNVNETTVKNVKRGRTAGHSPREPIVKPARPCGECGATLQWAEYWRRKGRCKQCNLSRRGRAGMLRTQYGITEEQYLTAYANQAGQCAICKSNRAPRGIRGLHVDHDHDTGTVRGLLCGNCNLGLGNFKDRIDVLEAAAKYLKFHSE